MNQILKDIVKNNYLINKGYVILPFSLKNKLKFLEDSTLLNKNIENSINPFSHEFHTSFFEKDFEYRDLVFKEFFSLFNQILKEYFHYEMSVEQINLINKPPNGTALLPHQDVSIVDEEHYPAFSIWAPLLDTEVSNGGLFFLEGSHFLGERHRNVYPPNTLNEFYSENKFSGLKPVMVSKNQVAIFFNSIVHGTSENKTDKNRTILHCFVKPKEAKTIFPVIHKSEANVYEVEDMFWQHFYPNVKIDFSKYKFYCVNLQERRKEYEKIMQMILAG